MSRRVGAVVFLLTTCKVFGFVGPVVGSRRAYQVGGKVASRKNEDEEEPVIIIESLVAGDSAILVSSSAYQALIATLLSDNFLGWNAPVTTESFTHIPMVISTAALSALIWIGAGLRHKIFSPEYAGNYAALLHASIDAATLRVLSTLFTMALAHQRIDVTLLEVSILANTLWILIWRLSYNTFIPWD